MWGTNDTVSNGACSDAAPSPVNGTALCDHNKMSDGAVNYRLSSSREDYSAHHVPSKFANENISLSKCATSEASDISASHGADASPPAAASVTCNSRVRTGRHLYSNHETDGDGYFVSNIDRNTQSTPNGAAGEVCQSLCSDRFSSSDVCLQSSVSVNMTAHSDSDIGHACVCPVSDSRSTENEQILAGAEADTSTSIPVNSDLCDDGYLDEIDDVALTAIDMQRHSDNAPWLVETDMCLDDFIDADMPHNAAVAGSSSSSSLSSTHEELSRMPENGIDRTAYQLTDNVINLSGSDVAISSRRQLHDNQCQGSSLEEHVTAVCTRLGHVDLNGSYHTYASQTQISDTERTHSWREINTQVDTANLALDSSHCSHESLPLTTDNYYSSAGNGDVPATAASDQVFEDSAQTEAGTSDTLETSDRPTSPKQNQSYWLPVGTESDVPKSVCWSCFEVMYSASLSSPGECVTPGGSLRLADSRDTGVMSRSATADYTSHDLSDLLTDDGDNLFASARMFSSLTL